MSLIYCAGPISQGSYMPNIRRGIEAGELLYQLGHTPVIPFTSALWQMLFEKDWEAWLAYDLELIEGCHALYRMEGPSSGADVEVAWAVELGLPVYYHISEVPVVPRNFDRLHRLMRRTHAVVGVA